MSEAKDCYKLVDTNAWIIEATSPPTDIRKFAHNRSVDVVAPTAERAIEVFRAAYPVEVIHVVRKINRGRTVLIDQESNGG